MTFLPWHTYVDSKRIELPTTSGAYAFTGAIIKTVQAIQKTARRRHSRECEHAEGLFNHHDHFLKFVRVGDNNLAQTVV